MRHFLHALWRWLRGGFWTYLVLVAGLVYYKVAVFLAWDTERAAAGLALLALVLWPAVSGLRFRMRF